MKDAITIGVDLGDKSHIAVVFDGQGNELQVARSTNTKAGVAKFCQTLHRTCPQTVETGP